MDLQRLVHDRVPFGAGGGAAAAVFRHRQMQRVQQCDDFLARRQMRHVRPRAERRLVEVVEGGLEIMNDEGTNLTLMANAAAIVYLDMPEKK